MPIQSGSGRASVGRDLSLVVVGPFGRVDLPNLTGFGAKQETTQIKSDRLDGVQLQAEISKGWSGTIENDRANSAVDDAFAQMETSWFEGGQVATGTIYQYITEADGSQTVYQFDNVAMKLDNAGEWKGDSTVKQTISWTANRRRKV